MKESSLKVQTWLTWILLIVGISFLITTYYDLYVPNAFTTFCLEVFVIGMLVVHNIQQNGNRVKEAALVFINTLYINLLLSGVVYRLWKWETILTQQGITRMSLVFLLILGIYVVIAYVRVKISYKKVKGNQRHNKSWRVSRKKEKVLTNSEDIYINLGVYQEKSNE